MAITCPHCGADYDATLFQFGHRVRCGCGVEVEYPGSDMRGGHTAVKPGPPRKTTSPGKETIGYGILPFRTDTL